MNLQTAQKLTLGRKLLLASLAAAAVTGPIALGLIHAPQLSAQPAQIAALPAPDIASVKPSHSTDTQDRLKMSPDGFTDANVTVKQLIELAYDVHDYQLVGAPAWTATDRYDVEARWKALPDAYTTEFVAPPPPPLLPPPLPPPPSGSPAMVALPLMNFRPGQTQAMVRALLADRFNLRLSHESQDLPVYALVVASTGAKLTETPMTPPRPTAPNGEPTISVRTKITDGENEETISNGPMMAVVGLLSDRLDRQVVDKTGLSGRYDVTLRGTVAHNGLDSVVADLQSQLAGLGLRLEPQQGPVEVLNIAEVEKPSND